MAVEKRLPLTPLSFQILIAVADEPRHGYGIIKEIEGATGEPMKSSTGTLYLAIERLEREDLLEERPSRDPRRRYYRLTALGRATAVAEAKRLATLLGVARGKKLVDAKQINDVLRSAARSR